MLRKFQSHTGAPEVRVLRSLFSVWVFPFDFECVHAVMEWVRVTTDVLISVPAWNCFWVCHWLLGGEGICLDSLATVVWIKCYGWKGWQSPWCLFSVMTGIFVCLGLGGGGVCFEAYKWFLKYFDCFLGQYYVCLCVSYWVEELGLFY